MSDFPSSRLQRGTVFAKTGLKLGTNYAKHYIRKGINGKDDPESTAKLHTENAQEIFKEFSKLRGTALKIAQSMSMDQGYLPEQYTDVLAQAQYKVPPLNKALVRNIIKKELGKYPEQLFKKFDGEAVAAASLGQVHRAETKDGVEVAVKIQYPNVRETIQSDLQLARSIFKRIFKGDIDGHFEEIKSKLVEETDYLNEGKQIEDFAQFYNNEKFATPRWIPELSTQRVLTMTFLKGRHLNEFLEEKPDQKARDRAGQQLWDFFHEQIERGNVIHADTHPGNFLFLEDGRLGIIDFGCVKHFPIDFFISYLRLLPTHLSDDPAKIRQLYIDMGLLMENPKNPEMEAQVASFCFNFGNCFALPYRTKEFDFADAEFEKMIKHFIKTAPRQAEIRGSKHFIFSSRVQIGLYTLLMKLGCKLETNKHIQMIETKLNRLLNEFEA